MKDWVLKIDTLARALQIAGRGLLREAVIFDEQGDEAVRVPLAGSEESNEWLPGSLSAKVLPSCAADGARQRNVRVKPLTVYGRPSGCLALVLKPELSADDVDDVVAAVVELVIRLAEMDLEIESLSSEVLRSYEAINFFYDLHSALAGTMDAKVLCRTILDRLMDAVACERGLILLGDQGREARLWVRAVRGEGCPAGEGEVFPDGPMLRDDVVEQGRAIVIDRVSDIDRSCLGGLADLAGVSLAVAPLRWEGRSLGAVALADRLGNGPQGEPGPFTSSDLKLLETISTQAAAILCYTQLMELRREIEVAQQIQTSLFPVEAPDVPGADLAGRCLMAGGVGGDLFDYSLSADGTTRLVVADVSGHNLASALMMTMARTALKIAGRSRRSPAAIARRINSDLYDDLTRAELFITMFLATYDPSRRLLTYCSAGHNPALLLRAGGTGRVESLKAVGVPAGILPSFAFEERTTKLRPGDVLMIYTDGLTEARGPSGEILGERRLARTLRRNATAPAGELLEAVFEDVERFTSGRAGDDDRTLVVLKILDEAAPGEPHQNRGPGGR